MLILDKAIYLSFLPRSILSARLSDSLYRFYVLPFSEFINTEFTFCIVPLLNLFITINVLVVSFARYKHYMIFLISFSNFSVLLPAFTFARATW